MLEGENRERKYTRYNASRNYPQVHLYNQKPSPRTIIIRILPNGDQSSDESFRSAYGSPIPG